MKTITKKRLAISLGVLFTTALIIWYFFPFFMGKWFIYHNEKLKGYLTLSPIYIETLPPAPREWTDIHLGGVILKQPISEFKKVHGLENIIYFTYKSGETILISDLAPERELMKVIKENKLKSPLVSYQDQLAIFKSLPSDISFLNSRTRNEKGAANQILKLISIPTGGLGEVLEINPKVLKAICIISEKREKGFSASARIYNQDETMTLSLLLMHYNDKALLRSDLLRILGGLSLPDQQQDIERIKADIDAIVKKYNRPEQAAPGDAG